MNISDNRLNEIISKTINLARQRAQGRRIAIASSLGLFSVAVAVVLIGAFLNNGPMPDLTVEDMPMASENPLQSLAGNSNEENIAVCRIGNARYTTFEDALAAVQSGQTITLLLNIKYTENITISEKDIIFDLSGFSLNVEVSEGNALSVLNGGDVRYINPGAFNVKTTGNGGMGVYADGVGSSARVTNAEAHGNDVNAVYTSNGGMIKVLGDATVSGIYIHAAEAMGDGSSIEITGDAMAEGDGKQVPDGIYVSMAVCAINGGSVNVAGNVTAAGGYIYGAGTDSYSGDSGDTTIKIDGDVIVTGDNDTGAFAQQSGCMVLVGGDVSVDGQYSDAVRAMSNALVEVTGSVTAEGSGSRGAVEMSGGIVRMGGDVILLGAGSEPSATADPVPTQEPTSEPTPVPAMAPTPQPTFTLTPEPIQSPKPEPTIEPTPQPTQVMELFDIPVSTWLIIALAVVAASVISAVTTALIIGRKNKQ